MDYSTFRKTIHLHPDNEQDGISEKCRSIVCLSRNSVDLLKINDQFKAIEFLQFEFPYLVDDVNWANAINSVVKCSDFQEAAEETEVEYWISDSTVTLVPCSIFSKKEMASYFQLLFKKPSKLEIRKQDLERLDAVGIYSVPESLSKVLSSEPNNGYLAWVNNAITNSSKTIEASLVISEQQFVLIIMKDGSLVFANWFDYSKADDVLYFLMATLESLNILHPEVNVKLAGQVEKGDQIYETISRFISKISFNSRPKSISYSYSFNKVAEHRFPFIFAAACA